MINEKILKDLNEIIESNIDPTMFPYQKGNSIRIGKTVIRKNKNGYVIYDITKEGSFLYETFCKRAAIALAKAYNKNRDIEKFVLPLDKEIEKQYIDSIFYKHTISTTKDEFKKEAIEIRYQIAKDRTYAAIKRLDCFIFS